MVRQQVSVYVSMAKLGHSGSHGCKGVWEIATSFPQLFFFRAVLALLLMLDLTAQSCLSPLGARIMNLSHHDCLGFAFVYEGMSSR